MKRLATVLGIVLVALASAMLASSALARGPTAVRYPIDLKVRAAPATKNDASLYFFRGGPSFEDQYDRYEIFDEAGVVLRGIGPPACVVYSSTTVACQGNGHGSMIVLLLDRGDKLDASQAFLSELTVFAGSGDDMVRGHEHPNAQMPPDFYPACGGGFGRLYGGPGHDRLVAGCGGYGLKGGRGDDRLFARNGERDIVRGNLGIDTAVVDNMDRVLGCETVRRATAA